MFSVIGTVAAVRPNEEHTVEHVYIHEKALLSASDASLAEQGDISVDKTQSLAKYVSTASGATLSFAPTRF